MLFCRRCHLYDCFLHKDKPVLPDLNNQSKDSDIIYRPCSSHCYRRKPISTYQQRQTKIELKRSHSEFIDNKTPIKNGFYPKRLKSDQLSCSIDSNIYQNGFLLKKSLKRKLTNEISNWLPSDKSLFRVFSTIFSENLCMIAHLLDKPCSQIYTFDSNEKKLFLQLQLSTLSTDSIDMKMNGEYKKKKNYGITINTNSDEELIKDEMKLYDGNDNQQSVSIRSLIDHETHLYFIYPLRSKLSCLVFRISFFLFFLDKYKSSFSFFIISSST
jgi:hypothetical protein